MNPSSAWPASAEPRLTSRVINRVPGHYSWWVLAAATFGMAMTVPGQTVGISVVLDSIIADLGLSRSAVSATYTVGTLAGSMSLPFIGRAIDRHGPRRSVIAIAIAFALACAFLGTVSGLVTLAIGFTLVRGLGQGALSLVSQHSINIWFVRRRGLAMGIAGVGFALATGLLPLAIAAGLEHMTWRELYPILGLIVVAVVVPVGGGFFRHQPERYGLNPDSSVPPNADLPSEHNMTAREARRTLTYWLYVTGGVLKSTFITGLIFHHFSIMSQNGITRIEAAVMFVGYAFIAAGANLVTGFLVDRIPPRFLLSGALAFLTAAMISAPNIASARTVVVYGAVLGTMQGMSMAVQSTVYAHYFGRKHLGAIKGSVSTFAVAGTAAGPLLLSVGFDLTGSYAPVLIGAALISGTLAVVAPFLPLSRNGRIL